MTTVFWSSTFDLFLAKKILWHTVVLWPLNWGGYHLTPVSSTQQYQPRFYTLIGYNNSCNSPSSKWISHYSPFIYSSLYRTFSSLMGLHYHLYLGIIYWCSASSNQKIWFWVIGYFFWWKWCWNTQFIWSIFSWSHYFSRIPKTVFSFHSIFLYTYYIFTIIVQQIYWNYILHINEHDIAHQK